MTLVVRFEESIHPADPSNWGFPSSIVQQFANTFLSDRAAVASAVGKPWVLEETGCNVRSLWQECISVNIKLLCLIYLVSQLRNVSISRFGKMVMSYASADTLVTFGICA